MRRVLVVLVAAVATATVMLFFGAASAQEEREKENEGTTTAREETTTAPENPAEEDFTVDVSSEDIVSAASKKKKSFTRTVSNTTQIDIPAGQPTTDVGQANPYPSSLTFSLGKKLKKPRITDVNLTINSWTQNGFPDDVDVLLVGPRGQVATVLSDVCDGGSTTQINATFDLDDEATNPIPTNAPCASGTYEPTNLGLVDPFPSPAPPNPSGNSALSVFDGTNPKGTWSLYVVDDAGLGGTGFFAGGWSLEITGKARRR